MAMRKVGGRCLEVGGQRFRWRIRRSPTYSQGAYAAALKFAFQHEDGGAVLVVICNRPRPDNWLSHAGAIITPAIVADFIRRAKEQGWRPGRPGPPIWLRQDRED